MTAPAIPANAADLEAALGDGETLKALDSPKKLSDWIGQYAQNTKAYDPEMGKQIENEVQKGLVAFLKENGASRLDLTPKDVVAVDRAARKAALHNPYAMGAPLDADYKSSAEYFATINPRNRSAEGNHEKREKLKNAFSSSVPSEGGFLIPERLRSELLRVSLETSITRPRARVIPMESLTVPFPAIDSTSNVSSVYGGIVAYWTEEGATLTASQASFQRIVLEAKKLTAYTEVPSELLADSAISFQSFIDEIFPEALGFYEDAAFISGTGVGEPLGWTLADAMVTVSKEAGQAADTIVWENIIKMYARMLPASLGRAVWVVSPDTFPELATMALTVGTGGSAVWLMDGTGKPRLNLLGCPVFISEKVSKLGDLGDINFVDLGYYLVGDRQVMSAKSSEEYKFGNDVTAFRIIQRLDGRPWLQSAITPKNNGASLSPFVKLEAR